MPRARTEHLLVLVVAFAAASAQDLTSVEKSLAEGRTADAELGARALLRSSELQKGRDAFESGQALDLLVKVLQRAGKAAEAETQELAERALAIKEKARGPESRQAAVSRVNLAALLIESGDYSGALPQLERARRILEESKRSGDMTWQACIGAQAALFQATGRLPEARDLFQRVLEDREKALGHDHAAVAWSLNNLAMCLVDMGEILEALPLERRALGIWENNAGGDPVSFAAGLNNLGWILFLARDAAGSRAFLARSLAIREASLGPTHPQVAATLENLAQALDALAEPEARAQALDCQVRALEIRKTMLGADHPLVARSHRALAEALARAGRAREALDHALEAESISRDHLRSMARAMAERESLLCLDARESASARTSGLDAALSLLPKLTDTDSTRLVQDAVVRSRAVVLDAVAVRRKTVSSPDSAQLVARLRDAARRLSNCRVRGPGDQPAEAYRLLLGSLRKNLDGVERELAEKSAAFREDSRAARLGLADVAARLPAGSALVSFVRQGNEAYWAFVLRQGDRGSIAVELGPAGELERLVRQWIGEASRGIFDRARSRGDAEAECRRYGLELARRVWEPIERHLQGATRAFVVLDAELCLLNLAALPAGETGYLVETGPLLITLSSERDLVTAAVARSGKGLLAVGGPSFDATPVSPTPSNPPPLEVAAAAAGLRSATDDCVEFRSVRFEERPAMLVEAKEAAALWDARSGAADQALLLGGEAATEGAFKAFAPGRRVVHIATHAFFLARDCGNAAGGTRGITRLKQAGGDSRATTAEGLLHLSGLAFAGANQRAGASSLDDDGILTAEEAATLDLSAVELVVLSACDTGVGRIAPGEGVLGLGRAFQLAGARSLVTTLWPVDDEAARAWMAAFYGPLLGRSLGAAEAARDASREVLRSRRANGESTHPFYWAAFVATE